MKTNDEFNSKEKWDSPWEDIELYSEIRRLVSSKTENYTIDEKLDVLIKNIPSIISAFEDYNSEEEYRMLAKKSDGTLASIQVKDKNTGFQVYSPIILDSYKYKKFYFETLLYSVITYIMFFKDIEFQIMCNNSIRSGCLSITDSSLPHLLGLEAKFVSSKDCALMERIIPGYNSLSILEKILCIIENNEKIIQYELENNLDVFNYYKNMQKNKEFLMLGRFFNKSEDDTNDKNKVLLMSNSDNQLCLYKKSNMNESMNRNICKIIIQQAENGEYFPRSLQAVSTEMLEGFDIFNFLLGSNHNIFLDGESFEMECQRQGIDGFILNVSNANSMRGYMYTRLFYQETDIEKELKTIESLLKNMKFVEPDSTEDLSQIFDSIRQEFKSTYENLNNVNLKSKFFMMYITQASTEQLSIIDELLDRREYQKINDIIEAYIKNIINNKDVKDLDNSGETSESINVNIPLAFDDMDPDAFELYCILALISLYLNEKDDEEKNFLYEEIQISVERYRNNDKKFKNKL